MSDLDHRVGVSEINLVNRKLQLIGLTEFSRAEIVSEIDQSSGIDKVSIDKKHHFLDVAYDATHINLEEIELIIRKHGADISDHWWNHLKDGYYKFIDQNIIDNAKHKPSCCHQAPPQSKKHK